VPEWTEPEYATVGSLLLALAELRQVAGWLRPEDFANPLCGEVYGLIVRMASAGIPVDPVTVRDELRRAGRIRSDGYPGLELVRMVEAVPSPLSVGYYGRLVVEAALYRRVEQAGTRLVQAGRTRRGEVGDVFGLLRDECGDLLALRRRHADAVATPPGRGGPVPVAALVRDVSVPNGQARSHAAGG
jgi:replicative DNA helicase